SLDAKKYKRAKQRVRELEAKADKLEIMAADAEHRIREKEQVISTYEAKLDYAQRQLEERPRFDVFNAERLRRQQADYNIFDRIIRFLEANLYHIDGVQEPPMGTPIEARLRTIVNSLVAKETTYAAIREESFKIKLQLEQSKNSSELSDKPTKPVEETLTRIMQQSEQTISSLRSENVALQTAHATHQEQLSALMRENEVTHAELDELKINFENVTKELTKSEKGRRTAQSARDAKEKELTNLEARFNSLDKSYRDKEKQVTRLQRELEASRRDNDRVRPAPWPKNKDRADILEMKIKSLERQLEMTKQDVLVKNEQIKTLATKCEKLEDNEDRELESLGRFRSDLAQVQLALSDNHIKSGRLEAALEAARQEMEARNAKASKERQTISLEMAATQQTATERENENAFLKEMVRQMELSAQDYRQHAAEDAQKIRQLEEQDQKLVKEKERMEQTLSAFKKMIQQSTSDLILQRNAVAAKDTEIASLYEALKKAGNNDTSQEDLASHQKILSALRLKVSELNQQLGKTLQLTSEQRQGHEHEHRQGQEGVENSMDMSWTIKADQSSTLNNNHYLHPELISTTEKLVSALEEIKDLRLKVATGVEDSEHHGLESRPKIVLTGLQADLDHGTQNEKEREAMRLQIEQLRVNLEQVMAGKDEEENGMLDELRLGLTRANEVIESMNMQLTKLKEEAEVMLRTREEMDKQNSQLRATVVLLEEKLQRQEKEIERRQSDLDAMISELSEARSLILAKDSAVQLLEESLADMKKSNLRLQQENKEQAEQIAGREKALERLDEARKMYVKVYESKVARLKEDKAKWEERVEAEWNRIRALHEQEIQVATEKYSTTLAQTLWNQETQREQLEKSMLAAEQRLNESLAKVTELEATIEKMLGDIVERNVLISGYMDFVTKQADGGTISSNLRPWADILARRYENMTKIEELEQKNTRLKEALDGQMEILKAYDQNMATFSHKHQNYLNKVGELELALAEEKRQRATEQQSYEALLATIKSTMHGQDSEMIG
ncbi:hypothetical protein BGZ94_003166, partial [Podila epigama]